jgi:hypothetical protein
MILKRAKEASTWAGVGVLLQVAKAFVPAPYHLLIDAASAAVGTLAMAVPEAGK